MNILTCKLYKAFLVLMTPYFFLWFSNFNYSLENFLNKVDRTFTEVKIPENLSFVNLACSGGRCALLR